MYRPEKYQLGILKHYLLEEGYTFTYEANLYSLPIDILAEKGNETVAIEMKSRNIERGIEQARRNTSFVDRSYLSVWEKQITDQLVARMDNLQIGLLAVGTEVQCLSPSAMNNPNPHARKRVKERVNANVRE